MNTHQIVDDSGNVLATGLGADLLSRADLLENSSNKLITIDRDPNDNHYTQGGTADDIDTSHVRTPGQMSTSQSDVARVLEDRAIVAAMGLAAPEAFFAPGTDMMACGEETYHAMKRGYDDLPSFRDAAEAVIKRIEGENRRDYIATVDATNFPTLSDDGWLRVDGRKTMMSSGGLCALMARFPEVFNGGRTAGTRENAATRWALDMGPKARAAAITDGFERYAHGVKKGSLKPRKVMLRMRDGAPGKATPVLWAAMGPKYPARKTDADAILREMINVVAATPGGDTVRGEVVLDPNTSRVQAEAVYWNTKIVTPKVGDIFRAFVRGSTRDDGMGAFHGSGGVEAIRCINCTTAESVAEIIKGIHRSEAGVMEAVRKLGGAHSMMEPLLTKWGYVGACDLALVVDDEGAEVTLSEPDAIFAAICADGELLGECLKDASIARDTAVELLLSAHKSEAALGRMDGSMLDIVRATAKAAQDRRLDVFQRAAMENASGHMLKILADGTIEAK